jgi:hypothetical protein
MPTTMLVDVTRLHGSYLRAVGISSFTLMNVCTIHAVQHLAVSTFCYNVIVLSMSDLQPTLHSLLHVLQGSHTPMTH